MKLALALSLVLSSTTAALACPGHEDVKTVKAPAEKAPSSTAKADDKKADDKKADDKKTAAPAKTTDTAKKPDKVSSR